MTTRVVGHLVGGLGNQLFIFAAAWALARRHGAELCLDTSAFAYDSYYKRSFALDWFGTVRSVRQDKFPIAHFVRALHKHTGETLPRHVGVLCETKGMETEFDPVWTDASLGRHRTLHVFGYRQNEKYFADAAEDLRRALCLNFPASPEAMKLGEEIANSGAACVSIRRLHGVRHDSKTPDASLRSLGEDYYQAAVDLICKRTGQRIFYCFGDTLEGVRDILPDNIELRVPPKLPDQPADILDFWLMLHGKHFVIANSTFSWWAAWLAQGPDSVVVCPRREGFVNAVSPASGWLVI